MSERRARPESHDPVPARGSPRPPPRRARARRPRCLASVRAALFPQPSLLLPVPALLSRFLPSRIPLLLLCPFPQPSSLCFTLFRFCLPLPPLSLPSLSVHLPDLECMCGFSRGAVQNSDHFPKLSFLFRNKTPFAGKVMQSSEERGKGFL